MATTATTTTTTVETAALPADEANKLRRKCYTDAVHKQIDDWGRQKAAACLAVIALGVIFFFIGLFVQLAYMKQQGNKWWAWAVMWGTGLLFIIIPMGYLAWKHEQVENCLSDYVQQGDESRARVCTEMYNRQVVETTTCSDRQLAAMAGCPAMYR
jgi:hypothetical protein